MRNGLGGCREKYGAFLSECVADSGKWRRGMTARRTCTRGPGNSGGDSMCMPIHRFSASLVIIVMGPIS